MKPFTHFFTSSLLTLLAFSTATSQNFEWIRGAGGTSFDIANDVTADPAGNSYATGWIKDTVMFDTIQTISTGGQDFFLSKYDPNGNLLWVVTGGGPSGNDQGYGVDVDAMGNVYVAGSFQDTVNFSGQTLNGINLYDIFIAKYDPFGSLIWIKENGSSMDDQANDIKVAPNGSVYICGNIGGSITFGGSNLAATGVDMFLAKYTSAGAAVWGVNGGGSSADNAYGMVLDESNGIYVTGPFRGTATFGTSSVISSGDDDIYLVKYDTSGAFQWVQSGGSTAQDQGNFVSFYRDESQVLLTGYFSGAACIFGLTNLTGNGSSTMFTAIYDLTGALVEADAYGSSSMSQGTGFVVDAMGNKYLLGQFNGSLTIDSLTITSNNATFGWDVLLFKFDTTGVAEWGLNAGGTGFWDTGNGLAIDGDNNVFFGGTFQGTAYFGTDSLVGFPTADMFIAKIEGDTLPIIIRREIPYNQDASVKSWPNPARENLYFEIMDAQIAEGELEIFDVSGRRILKQANSGERRFEVSLDGFQPGFYQWKYHQNDVLNSGKFFLVP